MARPAQTIFGSRILEDRGPIDVSVDDWRSLYYFNLYRLGLAVFFVTVGLGGAHIGMLGHDSPRLFLVATFTFALVAVFNLSTINRGRPAFATQGTIQILADLGLFTVFMHASGGVVSGVGLLMVVSVAAGGVALGGRKAIVFAAIGTIIVIAEHLASTLLYGLDRPGTTQIALLGIGLFATAFLVYGLAQRARRTEVLAERRGVDLANLEQVSRLVMDRLDTGIIAVDPRSNVRQTNSAARRMLGLNEPPAGNTRLASLAPGLGARYQEWREHPRATGAALTADSDGAPLRPRFISLGAEGDGGTLILLEDLASAEEHARQQRLAALGRLTAAIAHEVRNPLGAISHAAQLLQEAVDGHTGEARLVQIVLDHCQRINRLVSNVMQLGRRGEPRSAALDLQPFLQQFVRDFCLAEGLPADRLAIDGPAVCVRANADHLQQVLTNLCQNAVQHARGAGTGPCARLVTGTDSLSGRAYLEVCDRGPGVPPEALDRMFEPFFTTRTEGTGLGLFIARELCLASGASLQYRAGPGACFRVTFPDFASAPADESE